MKALPKKLLLLTVFAIAVTSLFSVRPAQAYTITLEQVGANVVANGSGAVNLTGLTFSTTVTLTHNGVVRAISGVIGTGPTNVFADAYFGFTGTTSFGSGLSFFADTSIGDVVAIQGFLGGFLFVPPGYVSGTPLSSSAIWNNQTFASLGVTPGTYGWSWGTGAGANQNFTLQIGPAGVPDGGSTVSLLGFGLLGLAALRRKFCC